MSALTYPDHLGGRTHVDCPLCGREALVDRHGDRLSVRCYAGCDRKAVAEAIEPNRAEILGELGAPAATTTTTRYADRVLDVEKMLAAPDEPIPWRCEGIAADGYLTVLAGKGGEGKSWMALTLACGVARGRAAAGIPCAKGKALLFDAENGPQLIARRFRAAAITAALAVQPVDAGGLRFSEDLDWMRSEIERHGANLVVFDSLRVLSSGEKESDGDAMEPIITTLKQLARDTGAAIVLVHHRGKNDLNDYRGSSVILDQTDLMLTLARIKEDPEARHRRKITTVKCRIDEEPAPRWVRIDADREQGLVTIAAAEAFDGNTVGSPVREALRDDVLDVLTGVSQSQARIAKSVGRDPKDQTVRRLLRDLEAEGLAEHRPDGWGVSTPTPKERDTVTPPPTNGSVEPDKGVSRGGVNERLCGCSLPARSPRGEGAAQCMICRRPVT